MKKELNWKTIYILLGVALSAMILLLYLFTRHFQ